MCGPRSAFLALAGVAGWFSAVCVPGEALNAAGLPADFTESEVAVVGSIPTAMTLAADGTLFITQKNGRMAVWRNGEELAEDFFAHAPLVLNTLSERGLLGVALDPGFAVNRCLYVYYTTDSPDWRNRVSRFTADSAGRLALPGSEEVIWEGDPHPAGYHNGGAIHFGPDGKLYIATGDNANGADAQSLTSQHGKILRVNADGSIPLDNPFHDSTGPRCDAIWSLGLRNPFTFSFQPGTGRLFINDVGQNSWEEINDGGLVQSGRGLNFGWPTTEGDFSAAAHPGFTRPLFAYNHNPAVSRPAGNVITGGAFYNPATNLFGAEYEGDYFFADLGAGWIYRLDPASRKVARFATNAGAVDLKVGADGALYYLAFSARKVFRVAPAGRGPQFTVRPENQTVAEGGQAVFQSAATDGARYQWQRSDSNGAQFTDIAGATARTLAFIARAADHNALFRVVASNRKGSAVAGPARLTVISGSAPREPVITVTDGLTADGRFVAGRTVAFSGSASDPEDGPLGPGAFSWSISFLTSIDQGDLDDDGLPGLSRPFLTLDDVASGAFTPATTGPYTLADVAYVVTLEVTDSDGLRSTARRLIGPQTSVLTLASIPEGLQVTRDGQPVTTPDSFTSVVGFLRPLGAPAVQTAGGVLHEFVSWSDGEPAEHTVSTPPIDTIYTVRYAPARLPDGWSGADVGSVGTPGHAGESGGTFALTGAGSLRGKEDAFHFAFVRATGDCRITARVVDLPLGRGGRNARAGVMIRSDLSAGAPYVFLGPKARGPLQAVSRDRAGRPATLTGAGQISAPCWVRIVREAGALTVFRSGDGVTWTPVRLKAISLPGAEVLVGLAVCSDGQGLQGARFDQVTVEP